MNNVASILDATLSFAAMEARLRRNTHNPSAIARECVNIEQVSVLRRPAR